MRFFVLASGLALAKGSPASWVQTTVSVATTAAPTTHQATVILLSLSLGLVIIPIALALIIKYIKRITKPISGTDTHEMLSGDFVYSDSAVSGVATLRGVFGEPPQPTAVKSSARFEDNDETSDIGSEFGQAIEENDEENVSKHAHTPDFIAPPPPQSSGKLLGSTHMIKIVEDSLEAERAMYEAYIAAVKQKGQEAQLRARAAVDLIAKFKEEARQRTMWRRSGGSHENPSAFKATPALLELTKVNLATLRRSDLSTNLEPATNIPRAIATKTGTDDKKKST